MFQTYIYSTRKQCDPKKRSCSRQRRRVCSVWNTSSDERKKGVGQSGSYGNNVVKQNQPKVRQFDLTGPPMISSSGKKPWTPFVIDLTYWSYNIDVHTRISTVLVSIILTNFCCWKSQHWFLKKFWRYQYWVYKEYWYRKNTDTVNICHIASPLRPLKIHNHTIMHKHLDLSKRIAKYKKDGIPGMINIDWAKNVLC